MVKFLKVAVGGQDYLIPCHKVIAVRPNSTDTKVDILFDAPLQTNAAAGAGEVAALQLVATAASDAPKTKVFANEVIAAIGKALEHSWTEPIVSLGGLTYPVTGAGYLHLDYSS
jgi:microcystin-dependent protein